MKYKNLISIIILLFFMNSFAIADGPGISQQFYGTVSVNGEPAPDGLFISAYVEGNAVSSTLTENGEYGKDPDIFYVMDPNADRAGKLITFYVDGVEAATYYFDHGKSVKLDLSIEKEVEEPRRTSSGGGGGGSLPAATNEEEEIDDNSTQDLATTGTQSLSASPNQNTCTPDWRCSDWLDCVNGVEKRVCTDKNLCGTEQGKPELTQSCEIPENPFEEPSTFSKITGAVVGGGTASVISLLLLVALILGGVAYRLYSKSK